jgi:hypothetical protein
MKKYYFYNYRSGQFIFEIRPDGNKWTLFCDNQQFKTYEIPEEAAMDVSTGKTGYQLWDKLDGEEPSNLSKWKIKYS